MNKIRSVSWSLFQLLFWSLIIWLSFYFFMDNVIAFFYGYRSDNFGTTFFNNQFWMVLHLIGGTMTLVLGPTQFWPFIRRRFVAFHRLAGKIYMLGILLIGISVARLAFVSSCVPCRVSLSLLGLFAVLSTWFAWKAIVGRNIKTHRQMMVRSYICVLGFVAVRIDQLLPMDFLFGTIEDPVFRRTVNEYFFSFVPLLIAEIVMVWIPSVSRLKRKKT